MTCGILVSWREIKPKLCAVEARSLNYWITGKSPRLAFLKTQTGEWPEGGVIQARDNEGLD